MILSRIDSLKTQWSEVVDTEERTTPIDYRRVAEIQGAINALMALMVEIDSIKA